MREGDRPKPVLPIPRDGIDAIVAHLEEDIIFGRLAPEARLTEDALMARFGASRHFIRQALVEMERRGVVRREKNVGAAVRSYSADEVRQIYDVREMLTRQAMLMVELPAPAALLARLRALQDAYRDRAGQGDLRGAHEANDAFHVALYEACGNPYLVRTLTDYMGLTLPMRAKNLADAEGLQRSLSQHEAMIALLSGRDRWALAQLGIDHMQASKADYLARIERHDPPIGLRRTPAAPRGLGTTSTPWRVCTTAFVRVSAGKILICGAFSALWRLGGGVASPTSTGSQSHAHPGARPRAAVRP